MKSACILLAAMLTSLPLAAQAPIQLDNNDYGMRIDQMPAWLIELSNMPKAQQEEYKGFFAAAKQAYAEGNWVICQSYLTSCDLILPNNPHSWNMRAACAIGLKKFAEAKEALDKVIEQDPNDAAALMNLATLHAAQEDYTAAINTIFDILERLPYNASESLVETLEYRILLYYLMQGNEAAAKEMVEGLDALSDTPLYYYSQAAFHIYHGRRTEAAEDLHSADSIFAKDMQYLPFARSLKTSGLEEKYLPALMP